MTSKSDDRIASAISRSDLAIVKVASKDHEKISNVLNELQSVFMQKCNSLGVPIKRGRSNNLPTISHAVNFLIGHASFNPTDVEAYTETLAKEATA
ncbi:hypothetical protein [Methanolobus sp. ZRKC5]|uniref:hypothetical protein n=1 Tax=unclassified Methanolobus TaxID=2629569 RepID=UPI00313F0901